MDNEPTIRSRRQAWGLWLGPLIFLAILALPVPPGLVTQVGGGETGDAGASARMAWVVLATLALMVVWWVSEAIPIPVTALLPMVVLPLAGVAELGEIAGKYLHPVVVLLLGGFILARSIERWRLHERIALHVVLRSGDRPSGLVGGFMVAAAILSMWISNTATAIMMVPIALTVAATIASSHRDDGGFATALLLGIAFACSIGGLGTYIGTPTNLLVKEAIEASTGRTITFLDWMMLGLPAVVVLVPLAWLVLTRLAFRIDGAGKGGAHAQIERRLSDLGTLSQPERRVLAIFALVALLWVFGIPLTQVELLGVRPFAGLNDQVSVLIGVILCFVVPAGSRSEPGARLLDWRTAEAIPWGVILLFGGGMALAGFIRSTGLGDWIGGELEFVAALPLVVLVLLVTAAVIFATEVTSNVATAAAVMPVLVALAESAGLNVAVLGAAVALSASCAFMLPMATGPNAVVYASGRVALSTMARAGLWLNLLAIPAITAIAVFVAPDAFW